MKVRVITSAKDADEIIDAASASAEKALSTLRSFSSASDALAVLWQMKSSAIGRDPLNSDTPLNLIEQLNQTFTYIASARAVKRLLLLRPEAGPFTLNLGTSSGSDIHSDRGEGVAAEVFAAVNTSNNRKLAKDVAKVLTVPARHKYVFFMCPGIEEGRQRRLESRYPDVEVWSVGGDI